MSKKLSTQSNQEEVFEIIELAIDEVDLLTKAFKLIGNVCDELKNPEPSLDSSVKEIIN